MSVRCANCSLHPRALRKVYFNPNNTPVSEQVYKDSNVVFPNIEELMTNFVVELCHNCGLVFQSSAYSEEYDNLSTKTYADYDCSEVFSFPDRSPRNADALEMIIRNLPKERNLRLYLPANYPD